MAGSGSSPIFVRFDQLQVDLSSGDLRKSDGRATRIPQQPLQVLRLLLQAEGRVVTREQLRGALWPEDTFVDFEHGTLHWAEQHVASGLAALLIATEPMFILVLACRMWGQQHLTTTDLPKPSRASSIPVTRLRMHQER